MKHQRIICFGDSITNPADLPVNFHWPSVLASRLNAGGPPVKEVFFRGLGGITSAIGMDRIITDVGPLLPALVLLEFGINDAYVNPWSTKPRNDVSGYLAQMEAMVTFIRAREGEPVFINNHPLLAIPDQHTQGNGRSIVENLKGYRAELKKLARRLKVPLLDLPSELGPDFRSALHTDGIHLTPASSVMYGEAVFRFLSKL
jgi:lysophospholipase L1-like esterase